MKIMPTKKCAVLLAAYNGIQYIEEQILSILKQTDISVTIFVSVDISNDGTYEYVKNLSGVEERVIVLPYGLKFGGAAPNFFHLLQKVDFTLYDLVAFADQDDIWNSNKLSIASQVLSMGLYDAYSSNVNAFWDNGKQILINKAHSQVEWDYLFEAAGPGCTYVFSKKLAIEIQHFVINHQREIEQIALHDWFCYAYARANDYKWYIDSLASMLYRQHERNQVGVNIGYKAILHRLKLILNGWCFNQAALLAILTNKNKTNFVKRWFPFSRLGFIKLAFYARKCRRNKRDQCVFFIVTLLVAVLDNKKYDYIKSY